LSSAEVRQPGKAPNYSVNWTVGCTQPEIIDAMKGKEQVRAIKKKFSRSGMSPKAILQLKKHFFIRQDL
jgi:hypothetical protein